VNRGWVPRNMINPITRHEAQVIITLLISNFYNIQYKLF